MVDALQGNLRRLIWTPSTESSPSGKGKKMKFRRAVALVRDVPVVRFELRRSLAAVTGLVLISCAGCGDQQFKPASTSPVSGLSGTVHGGQQPITGATIQLYATGALGDGSSSTPLLSAVVKPTALARSISAAFTPAPLPRRTCI